MKYASPRIKQPALRITPIDTSGGFGRTLYRTAAHQTWAKAVKRRDGYTCQSCGANGEGVSLIADHIREIRDGGAPLDMDNGQTLCAACHARKTRAAKLARR